MMPSGRIELHRAYLIFRRYEKHLTLDVLVGHVNMLYRILLSEVPESLLIVFSMCSRL
jgi:hypothetical protein